MTGDGTRIPEAKQWYVTAPHRMANRTGAMPYRVPYGISHVRTVGGLLTACGLPALVWPIFWDLPIANTERLCIECRRNARLTGLEGLRGVSGA